MAFMGGGYSFKKRKKPKPEPITQKEIFEIGKQMKPQLRAFFYFLFLTGARISEALQVQVRNINLTTITLSSGKVVEVYAVDLITLKRRSGFPRRTVYIFARGMDAAMLKPALDIANDRLMDDDYIFQFGDMSKNTDKARWRVYYQLKKIKYRVRGYLPPAGNMVSIDNFHMKPHYMRHCRAYCLKKVYRLTGDEAKAFFGWSSSAMYDEYGQESSEDALERMVGVMETPSP